MKADAPTSVGEENGCLKNNICLPGLLTGCPVRPLKCIIHFCETK